MMPYKVTARPDARDGSPVAVLLHGRGAHRGDLQALAAHFPADFVIVTPQAPHPGHPWGYGPGWAWYRHIERDRVDDRSLEASLDLLDEFMDQLSVELPFVPGSRFIGGFNQGATTALAWALRRPGAVDGVLCLSGFVVDSAGVPLDAAPRTPVFWSHGRRDPSIPFALAEDGRERLRATGAEPTVVDTEVGHWIDVGSFATAVEWMDTLRAAASGS